MNPTDPRLARVLLMMAIIAVYMPLVGGGFVWDDHLLVTENRLTHSLANIPQMFATDLWGSTPVPDTDPGYYRPLMLVDLAITRFFADLNHRIHNHYYLIKYNH